MAGKGSRDRTADWKKFRRQHDRIFGGMRRINKDAEKYLAKYAVNELKVVSKKMADYLDSEFVKALIRD